MRMDSISPRSLLQRADWRDYLRIALHNLTPRGYQPPHAPLASQDGNNHRRRGEQKQQEEQEDHENEFSKEYAKLPPMSWEEKVIVTDFVAIALLWFFRDPKGACVCEIVCFVYLLCVVDLSRPQVTRHFHYPPTHPTPKKATPAGRASSPSLHT